MPRGGDRNQPDFLRFQISEIEQSIASRFAQQVARHPDRLAVKSTDQSLSYRQLDEKSNQVAHRILAARGARSEPIAFLLDQGASSVVTILGILKAGNIYVALEPSLPEPELARIVADCSPGLVLTDSKHSAHAGELARGQDRCINVDAVDAGVPAGDVGLAISPDRLAYIFYTSGSTGPPKGVCDSHRNVLHNIMRYTNNLQIGSHDRLSLVQSCAFSGTVSSLFAALLNGASVFPFDLQNQGVERLANWVTDEKLTMFHGVPLIFEQLLATGREFKGLRLIRLEGDQAHQRHVAAFQGRFGPHCVLVNGLGATETGIVRQFFVTPETALPGTAVPIGHAIEDMEVLLLDDDGQPVANGAVGEIAIRSRYLAVGYWKRPDFTAQAFRKDSEVSGCRVYRTGDIGRMLPGDCLQYLGRKDFRAKVRGQRIEIAEIEDRLRTLQSVKQALVTVREDRPGRQQLVAYIVAATEVRPTVTSLRKALSQSLPEIMIPVRYVFLDALPLDRNRKVLRRALPAPDGKRPTLDTAFVAARNRRQKLLTSCFEEVLGISGIGLHDDFFDLGGDSLLATELILHIEEKLNVAWCPTEFLFAASSIAGLEELLQADRPKGCAATLQPQGAATPLFCMHNYSGHALHYRHLARLLAPDQPVVVLQRVGLSDAGDTNMTVADMARVYVAEVRRIQPVGAYHLCGNCFDGVVAFEVARQLRAAGQDVALLGLIDTAFPVGPMRRFVQKLAPERRLRLIARMPLRERLTYVASRTRGLVRWVSAALHLRARSYAARLTSPSDEQDKKQNRLELDDANHLAAARYKPRPYDGAAVLFCLGPPPHHQLGWRSVTKRGFKIVQLPLLESTDRDSKPHLHQHPYVVDLAAELRKLLTT